MNKVTLEYINDLLQNRLEGNDIASLKDLPSPSSFKDIVKIIVNYYICIHNMKIKFYYTLVNPQS